VAAPLARYHLAQSYLAQSYLAQHYLSGRYGLVMDAGGGGNGFAGYSGVTCTM
jgi:hypothetical protein